MGRNLGRAIESIGGDVLAWSQLQQQGRLRQAAEALRDQRERDIAELRASIQRMGIEARGTSRSGAGGPPSEFEAGIYGLDLQPRQPGDFTRDANPVAFDDEGNKLPEARVPDADAFAGYKSGQRRAFEDLQAGRNPAARDDYARGRQTERLTQGAFSTDASEVERTRRASRAIQGKDRFKVDGDEKIDEFSDAGFRGQTAQGQAKVRESGAKASRAAAGERQSEQLRAADGSVRSAQQQLEAELNAASRALRDNPSAVGWDADRRDEWLQSRPAVQQARKALADAQRRRDAIVEGDGMEEGFRSVRGGPAPRPALPAGVTRDQALQQARQAIARGASRDAVIQRLRGFGIDPGAL